MKKVFFVAAIAALALSASAKKDKQADVKANAATVSLKSSSDSLSYAAGYAQTNGLLPYLKQQFNVEEANMADFIQGLKDAKDKMNDPRFKAYQAGGQIAQMISERMIPGIGGELKDSPDSLSADLFYAGFLASLANDTATFKQQQAETFFRERLDADVKVKNEALKKKGQDWLAENAKKDGIVTTASGLQYKVITMGTGVRPKADQEVTVKYEGHLIDGTEFDSSYKRPGETSKFKANQVIKGWTEGLQLMPVGSKFEFYIPQELAYGERPTGKIPAFSTLCFTVELVDVKDATAPKVGNAAPAAPAVKTAAKPATTKATSKKK